MKNTNSLTRGAIIAALYAAVTLLLAPISYGEVQVRISESLTLLPILLPEAVPALAIGCLLANILGGATIFDVVFGTLATLLAAVCTRVLRKNRLAASAMPVLFNGAIVGPVVYFAYVRAPGAATNWAVLWSSVGTVALGEAVVCYVLGLPLLKLMQRVPEKYLER